MRHWTPPFSVPIAKAEKVGPENMPHFWHPGRPGVRTAPEWFKAKLDEFDPSLRVTWNPIIERWQVWEPAPRVQYKLCPGWKLLFIHRGPSGEYLPLDERIFARLYHASVREWGSGKAYYDRLVTEMARDREKAEAQARQDSLDKAMVVFDHAKIKNIGKGSKFSEYHA